MMTVGLYQFILLSGGQGVPSWMIGGHAHLDVLSMLAIVMSFAEAARVSPRPELVESARNS
jgi:hypothetical protein